MACLLRWQVRGSKETIGKCERKWRKDCREVTKETVAGSVLKAGAGPPDPQEGERVGTGR